MEACVFKKARYIFSISLRFFCCQHGKKSGKLMKAHIYCGVEDQDFNISSDLSVAWPVVSPVSKKKQTNLSSIFVGVITDPCASEAWALVVFSHTSDSWLYRPHFKVILTCLGVSSGNYRGKSIELHDMCHELAGWFSQNQLPTHPFLTSDLIWRKGTGLHSVYSKRVCDKAGTVHGVLPLL